MEQALSFLSASECGEDVYKNAENLWTPVWGRGIFGGGLIAQSLVIAQHTVPSHLLVHSTHCSFIAPTNNHSPIFYHVRRLQKGRNSATRIVEAWQAKKCVFVATLSFLHGSSSADKRPLEHQVSMPSTTAMSGPPSEYRIPVDGEILSRTCQADRGSLYDCVRLPIKREENRPQLERLHHWIRTRDEIGTYKIVNRSGVITPPRQTTHFAALAYE